jgi:hypothetical protein
MVLGVHGQALLAGHEAGAACDRPALEHAAELQPEIEVNRSGFVGGSYS